MTDFARNDTNQGQNTQSHESQMPINYKYLYPHLYAILNIYLTR
jgi:hypothetical protein